MSFRKNPRGPAFYPSRPILVFPFQNFFQPRSKKDKPKRRMGAGDGTASPQPFYSELIEKYFCNVEPANRKTMQKRRHHAPFLPFGAASLGSSGGDDGCGAAFSASISSPTSTSHSSTPRTSRVPSSFDGFSAQGLFNQSFSSVPPPSLPSSCCDTDPGRIRRSARPAPRRRTGNRGFPRSPRSMRAATS